VSRQRVAHASSIVGRSPAAEASSVLRGRPDRPTWRCEAALADKMPHSACS